MRKLSQKLEFEDAAKIRDEIKRLQILELTARSGDTETETSKTFERELKDE